MTGQKSPENPGFEGHLVVFKTTPLVKEPQYIDALLSVNTKYCACILLGVFRWRTQKNARKALKETPK